jgi:hypothetical protein
MTNITLIIQFLGNKRGDSWKSFAAGYDAVLRFWAVSKPREVLDTVAFQEWYMSDCEEEHASSLHVRKFHTSCFHAFV